MTIEASLHACGFVLRRPLESDCYDFAYRVEQIPLVSLALGQALLRDCKGYREHEVNGYTNVSIDLWDLHFKEGWPKAAMDMINNAQGAESIKRRAQYLSLLLPPLTASASEPMDTVLKQLLQYIHFPKLYGSSGMPLGRFFWEMTLERPLKQLALPLQGQIQGICQGICPNMGIWCPISGGDE